MSDMDDDELEATRQFYGVGRKKKKDIEVGPGGPMDEESHDKFIEGGLNEDIK